MESFEKRLERLEQISGRMREQDITLQESLELFEEGIRLSRELEEELKAVQQRVEILTSGPEDDGDPETEPFEGA